MIYDNLSRFADFFQDLKIDLYQNQSHMLIVCKYQSIGDFIVNLLWSLGAKYLSIGKNIDKNTVFYLTKAPCQLFIILID